MASPGEVPKQTSLLVPAELEQRALGALGAQPVLVVPGQPGHRAQRQRIDDVDEYVLDVLVVARDDRVGVVAQPARALDKPEVAGPVVGHPPEHRVVLRRVVEARFVGMNDRDQAVAVRVTVAVEPVVVQAQRVESLGRETWLVLGCRGHELPGDREERRLDVGGGAVAAHGVGGVEGRPAPPGVVVPEDRVRDESIQPTTAKQGAELLACARGIEVAPDDRVKA